MTIRTGNVAILDSDGNENSATYPLSTALASGSVVDLGAKADAAVVDPTAAASAIAALKGILTDLGPVTATAVTNPASSASVIAASKGILTGVGQIADVAVTDPTTSASVIAALKGILTDLGPVTASAVSDPTASAGAIAALKGLLTQIGILTSAAVTDPAASGNLNSLAKGILTLIGALTATAVTDPTASGSTNALIKGLLKQLQGTGSGSAPVTAVVRETAVGTDQTATWAASSVVNTQKDIDITEPTTSREVYQFLIENPSRVTDLEVELKAMETSFNSATTGITITTLPVPKATSAVLFDCETAFTAAAAQGAHVVCTADAAVYLVGAKSAKMAMDADAATGLLASVVITSANLSIYTHVQFWLRSSVNLDAGDLLFLADNTALCASPYESLSIPAITADTWTLVTLKLATPTTDLACICLGVSQVVDKGAFDLYLDDIVAFKPGYYAPLVTGIFNGSALRVSPKNSTALGANDAFTATFRLREYK